MATATIEKPLTPPQLADFVWRLPKSWTQAAGLLRNRGGVLERHVRRVRREWDKRAPGIEIIIW